MKDITHYFVDTAKVTEASAVESAEEVVQESEIQNSRRNKRNRVKIKISRRSSDERECKIIDTNNDMVDKTPSPFTKVKKGETLLRDTTPKKPLTEDLFPQTTRKNSRKQESSKKQQVLTEVNLNHDCCESNTPVNSKRGKTKSSDSLKDITKNINETDGHSTSSMNKGKRNSKSPAESSKKYENKYEEEDDEIYVTDVITNGKSKINLVDLTDDTKEDENNQIGESNAFQILMSKSRLSQSTSPTTPVENSQLHVKKSEEDREKLKRTKEKLIALADKKGYSKRKTAEMEESERIEEIIENRIKSFTREGRKESSTSVQLTQENQKQGCSNLLNYFGKSSSLGFTPKNSGDVSTFIVKADVHASEQTDIHKAKSKILVDHKIHSTRTKKNANTWQSEADSITEIEPEDTSSKSNERTTAKQNKSRWSMRIKLQENINETTVEVDSSDEEIFSHPNKSKKKKLQTESQAQSSGKTNSRLKSKSKNSESCLAQVDSNTEIRKSTRSSMQHSTQHVETENNDEPTTVDVVTNINANNNSNGTISNENTSKRKSAQKLAPLFTKRRKPDPEILAARRLFLQPDINDTENKSTDRKCVAPQLAFPKISHITQYSNSEYEISSPISIPMKKERPYIPNFNTSNYKYIEDVNESSSKQQQSLKKLNKHNIQETIAELEEHCSDVTAMWHTISQKAKKSSKTSLSKTKSKSGKSTEKALVSKNQNTEDHELHPLWIYKYKPRNTQEIVGNEDAAKKLRDWLSGWRAGLNNEDYSSGDEFYSSDCSYSSSRENNQIAILLGPHGSGKSASIYAVAEEFGYTVLEMNASSRRTGKKLLKEFEEATKSHRIKKDGDLSLFKTATANAIAKTIPQNSLILLEDVDIIFEEDEGFISATYQLASNSKRPIAMTCSQVCPQLNKMAPQQNRIYFQNPSGTKVTALLELIALAETGYRLTPDILAEILHGADLRKALLQLQYLLLSGPPRVSEQKSNIGNTLWCDMRYSVYKPAIKLNKMRKAKKRSVKLKASTNDNVDVLNSVAMQLDNIALISTLIDVNDSVISMSKVTMQPSLSLTEDDSLYCSTRTLSSDIAEWIGKKVAYDNELSDQEITQHRKNILLKKELNNGVGLALSHVTSDLLDQRTISVDYLPSIRTICRAEESRSGANSKRGNRFFHYLHGLKLPAITLRPNILSAACKAMQDKDSENGKVT